MKKYLKGLALTLVAIIALVPFVGVKADDVKEINQATFTQAVADEPNAVNGIAYVAGLDPYYTIAAGSYKLTGDIELDKPILVIGNVTIDTSGKTLASTAIAALTVDDNNSLTLNGTGIIRGNIQILGESNLTITDGNFINEAGGAINVQSSGIVTISGGEFNTTGSSAIYVMNAATLTISGGEFVSQGDNGIEAEVGVLNISGGLFKGAESGIMLGDTTLNLSGGKFISTTNQGGITTFDNTATNDTFNSWLLEGYEYSPAVSVSKEGIYAFSQKEIEVKKIATEEATEEVEEPKTNNPNTSDDIMIYISLLGLSLIGLTGLKLSKKGLI